MGKDICLRRITAAFFFLNTGPEALAHNPKIPKKPERKMVLKLSTKFVYMPDLHGMDLWLCIALMSLDRISPVQNYYCVSYQGAAQIPPGV